MSSWAIMLIQIYKKIQLIFAKTATPLYCLLYGHEKDQTIWTQPIRTVCSFLLGILFGYLIWLLLSINCNLDILYENEFVKVQFFTVFLILHGLSYVISRNARAITLLIFVTLADKAGRIYFRAAVFGLVICGPIGNLITNAAEVARVFACTNKLTYNVTKTQLDILAKPFTDTLQYINADIYEVQNTFKDLEAILSDLKYGMEHADSEFEKIDLKKYRRAGNISLKTNLPTASEVQQEFVRKLENRCRQQLNAGHQVCQEVFNQGFRKCATNFPNWQAKAICWPYRIDIICKVDMFGNPEKVCDASKVVPSDFGKTYISLLKTEQELFGNSSNMKISFKVQNTSKTAELSSAQQTSDGFMNDFERRKGDFKIVMAIIENLMCLCFFFVIWKAMKYHWNYRSKIDYDNYYLTDYFKHLDARRKFSNQRSVFPMRRLEKYITVDTDELCTYTFPESSIEIYHVVQLWLEMLTSGIFICLDLMVVHLLQIIKHRSLISYHPEGEHEVRFRINGTGLMARLLRKTMKNFNIHERISTSLSNEECLPNVHALPTSFYIKLILIYFIVVVLIYYGTFILRLRRGICSYFFYKREKQRILFLYGTMLRNHASYLNDVRQMTEINMSNRHIQGHINIFMILRLSYPKHFGWLGKFNCAKRYCLICSALENNKFVICQNCSCPFCRSCCRETNWICLFCEKSMSHEKSSPNEGEMNDTKVDLYTYRKKKSL